MYRMDEIRKKKNKLSASYFRKECDVIHVRRHGVCSVDGYTEGERDEKTAVTQRDRGNMRINSNANSRKDQ